MGGMEMIAAAGLIGRLVVGSDDGVAGKVARVLGGGAAAAVHRGTIADVERRVHACGAVRGHKSVPPEREARTRDDVAALRALAWAIGTCNAPLADSVRRTAADIEAELDMGTELARTIALGVALRGAAYAALAVTALVPVPDLCGARELVYAWAPGAPLSPEHGPGALRRYVLAFFELMHTDGIIMLDASPQNVIVEPGTGALTLIDAGATRAMSNAERCAARALHLSRGRPEQLRAALGGPGVSDEVVAAVGEFSKPFWDPAVAFPDFGRALWLVASPARVAEALSPGAAPVARAMVVIGRTISQLGFSRIDVASAMRDIESAYLSGT